MILNIFQVIENINDVRQVVFRLEYTFIQVEFEMMDKYVCTEGRQKNRAACG